MGALPLQGCWASLKRLISEGVEKVHTAISYGVEPL